MSTIPEGIKGVSETLDRATLFKLLDCLAHTWLGGRVVAERDAERVGVQAGLAEPAAPAGEDPANVARRVLAELSVGLFDDPTWICREDSITCYRKAFDTLCSLVRQRDDARAALARHVKESAHAVEVLAAETRKLGAAKASADEHLKHIRLQANCCDRRSLARMGQLCAADLIDYCQRLDPPGSELDTMRNR